MTNRAKKKSSAILTANDAISRMTDVQQRQFAIFCARQYLTSTEGRLTIAGLEAAGTEVSKIQDVAFDCVVGGEVCRTDPLRAAQNAALHAIEHQDSLRFFSRHEKTTDSEIDRVIAEQAAELKRMGVL